MAGRRESAERRAGTFDAFDLASRHAEFAGRLDAASLPRVVDRLAGEGGAAEIAWRIAGTADALQRPALEIALTGAVPLVCQRCLRPFEWPVAQRTMLLLARDDGELATLDQDDEHEVVLAAAPLDSRALIEDELLLSLPFAPVCARPDCRAGLPGEAPAAESSSAFAALAALKKDPAKEAKD